MRRRLRVAVRHETDRVALRAAVAHEAVDDTLNAAVAERRHGDFGVGGQKDSHGHGNLTAGLAR